MTTKHVRDQFERIADEVAGHGASALLLKGKKHYQALVELPNGRSFKLSFAGTPGCGNAARNNIQDLRRLLREHGA